MAQMQQQLKQLSRENNRAVSSLRNAMRQSATLDVNTGKVTVNQAKIKQALRQQMSNKKEAERIAAGIAATARSGVKIIGPKDDPAKGVAMPWRAIEHVALVEGGLPQPMLEALGTANAGPRLSRTQLEDLLPDVPDDVFEGPRAQLLARPSNYKFAVPPELPASLTRIPEPGDRPGTGTPGTPGRPGTTLPGADELAKMARDAAEIFTCLVNATWSGWFPGWLGWLPGWKVVLPQDCASKMADLLMGTAGADLLSNVIRTKLAGGTWAAALKAVLTPVTLVFPLIGYLLGLNIKAVNWLHGTHIYCSWPWTGGIVFWAAAAPRPA